MTESSGVTILIPIKVSSLTSLNGFRKCYQELLSYEFPFNLEIVIADESPHDVFQSIDDWFGDDPRVIHFCPKHESRHGKNDKMNGIYDALNHVKYERVILIDDHYRLSADNIFQLIPLLSQYDCFKCMITFPDKRLTALIDLCGMFIINLTHPLHQFHGHLCFNARTLKEIGFPSRDGLFDELALEMHFHLHARKVHFEKNIFLKTVQDSTYKRFLEQRVRYAYENFAFPFRFACYLSILPILLLISMVSVGYAFAVIGCLTLGNLALALWGQIEYGQQKFPAWTFLLAPLWFWFYPFTTWIAVLLRFSGGIKFGGRKIVRPI